MDPLLNESHRSKVQEFLRKHRIGLLTLLFTDIVGSTRLKQVLGDGAAVMQIKQHHQLLRELLKDFSEAEEISTAGDSFFIVFARPSDALRFALRLQSRLRASARELPVPILDRIGIHVGEVVIDETGLGDGGKDLYGMQVDNCARLMSLGEGDQILMSRVVFDNARQVLRGQDLQGLGELSWLNHGAYLMKGIEEPIEVCEVGELGKAAMAQPKDSEKARRHATAAGELVPGWRPALGQTTPGSRWVLEEKLGEGAFGEVWLARHETLKDQRVLKFCFRADRVRSLKREATIFRLLRERAGNHPGIVTVHDLYLDEPPYYLVMDYVPGRDLKAWCARQGGLSAIPIGVRLSLVADVAEALQAAHEAGIIHRDIKPTNILVAEPERQTTEKQKSIHAKLTDFGIGQVTNDEALAGLTNLGFTQTLMSPSSAGLAGTQAYMAPEVLAGKPATTRSDTYSLGVLLYQMIVGDWDRHLTMDWPRDIEDSLLREDLARCFAGDFRERFAGPGELARRLHSLDQRRADQARAAAAQAVRERAAYRRGMVRTAGVALLVIAVVSGLLLLARRQANENRRRLARNSIEQGMRLGEESDLLGALAWFADVLNLDRGDPKRERAHRMRLAAILAQCPKHAAIEFDYGFRFEGDGKIGKKPSLSTEVRKKFEDLVQYDFSPDFNRFALVNGNNNRAMENKARVFDAQTGAPASPVLQHAGEIHRVTFHPDGQHVLTASADGTARIWNTLTGESQKPLLHAGPVHTACFSVDGKLVATGSADRTACVWDGTTGELVAGPLSHPAPVYNVKFDPETRLLLTGSANAVFIWDIRTGRCLAPNLPHHGWNGKVIWSPNGSAVLTESKDRVLQLWNPRTGEPIGLPMSHKGTINSVQFSRDGRYLITGSADRNARVWNAATGEPALLPLGHRADVANAELSPNGRELLTSTFGITTTFLWNLATNATAISLQPDLAPVHHAEFSPNGAYVVTASASGSVQVWNAATAERAGPVIQQSNAVLCVAFGLNGKRLLTGSTDGTARLWDATTGRSLLPPLVHGSNVVVARFSADGKSIFTATADRKARFWNSENGQPLGPPLDYDWENDSLVCRKDGRQLVSVRHGFEPSLWDVAAPADISPGSYWHVSFLPDGRVAYVKQGPGWGSSGENIGRVWDHSGRSPNFWQASFQKMRPVMPSFLKYTHRFRSRSILSHDGALTGAAYSPDGRRIVTTGADAAARVWDATAKAWPWDESGGKRILPLLDHRGTVLSAEFSHDGRFIVTASADHTARIWDAATGDPISLPLVHPGEVTRATFSPDGSRVLTLSAGTARIWAVPIDERPIEDLVLLARFTAGGEIDTLGGFSRFEELAFVNAWQLLQTKYPKEFQRKKLISARNN